MSTPVADDPCDSAATDRAYLKCRFDRLEAKVDALTPKPTPPPPPTPEPAFTVTKGAVTATTAEVKWSAVAGATGYYVERSGFDSRYPDGADGWGTTDPATSGSRVFNYLMPGKTYTLSVTPKPAGTKKSITVTIPAAPTPTPTPTPTPGDPSPRWASGAAGPEAGSGAFGAWRGSKVEAGTTWVDNPALYTLTPNSSGNCEWCSFNGVMNIAINPSANWQGWSAEANGAHDQFFRDMFRQAKKVRAGKGPVYLSPYYELNGFWMGWSVKTDSDAANFKRAWQRVYDIARTEYPEAKLMLTYAASDWYGNTKIWPGANLVDVVGINFYNEYPHVTTSSAFTAKINQGGGLETLRKQALGWGLPVALPEWGNASTVRSSGDGGGGESPQFMRDMRAWLTANAGTGPGQVLWETYFNIAHSAGFHLFTNGSVNTKHPNTAAEYQRLW